MFEFLNHPYPFSFQPKRRIKQLLPVGLCVFLFLILFKPFGQNNDRDYISNSAFFSFVGISIGLITTVLIPYLIPSYFNESKWTVKRNLLWCLWMNLIFATLFFFAFNIYITCRYNNHGNFTFKTYLWWTYIQLIFGVPLSIIINLVNQYYLLKKHLKIASSINTTIDEQNTGQSGLDNHNKYTLPTTESRFLEFEIDRINKVKFGVDSLICVEALGNYVILYYQHEGNRKITIRETISNIELKIGSPEMIYRPHRSYLVNMQKIERVTGDSLGLKIHCQNFDKVIPVSRNKIKEFKKLVMPKL